MRVLILHDTLPENPDTDEAEVLVQADVVRAALHELGYATEITACTLDLAALSLRIAERPPDVVFNLVESLDSRGSLVHLVPSVLDGLGVRYSGSTADALFAASNKVMAKRLMRAAGIPTPEWRTLEELRSGAYFAPGRYILKSVWEHASWGIEKDSVIEAATAIELAEALERRWDALAGEGFVEAYVHGRELRVTMLAGVGGPQVLPISEIVFEGIVPGGPRIDTYAAKWDDTTSNDYTTTARRFEFPAADAALLGEVERIGLAVWSLFGLRGYARVDLRVDEVGRPWVIDVNANPSLSPIAGFAAAVERAGIAFDRAIERILEDIPARVGAPT